MNNPRTYCPSFLNLLIWTELEVKCEKAHPPLSKGNGSHVAHSSIVTLVS